jgi:glutaminase
MSGGVRRKSRASYISTGHLPSARQVQATVDEAYRLYRTEASGAASQTYPALARVPGQLLGICVAGVDGGLFRAGDSQHEFTIMSVAKPFVFALVGGSWVPSRSGRSPASTPPAWPSAHGPPSSAARRSGPSSPAGCPGSPAAS